MQVTELCPQCGREVLISSDMVIQECPNCNACIIPCSQCDWDNTKCADCELAKICDERRNS